MQRTLTDAQLLVFSFVLTGVLFGGVFLFLVPSFRTNDDVAMAMWAQGVGLGVEPTEYIVFSNVLIGLALKGLYRVLPSVPWYGAYLYGALVLSTALTFFAILRWSPVAWRMCIPIVLALVAYIEFFTRLQFTIVAFLVTQSGVILFLSVAGGGRRAGHWWWLVVSALLVAFGAAIRVYSCALVLLLAAPALAVSLALASDKRAWLQAGGVLAAGVIVSAGLEMMNRAYYAATPEWANFFGQNALIARFTDYLGIVNYTKQTKPIFDAVGWSYNDFRMLTRWFFADSEVFSADKMRQVLGAFAGYRTGLDAWALVLLVTGMINDSAMLRAMVFCIFLFALLSDRRGLFILGGTVLSLAAAVAYLLLFLKLPDRVYLPMFGFVTVVAGLCATQALRWRAPAGEAGVWVRTALVGILGLLVVWQLSDALQQQVRKSRGVRLANRRLQEAIAALQPAPDQLFVVWGAALPMEYFLPLQRMDALERFKMLGMGATGQSPLAHARMAEFGVTDVYRGLFERPRTYLIAFPKDTILYRQYVMEHYARAVDIHQHFVSRAFRVYEVVKPASRTG